MSIELKENTPIIVDGKEVTKEEFEKLMNDTNIKLKQIKENTFIILKKLYG